MKIVYLVVVEGFDWWENIAICDDIKKARRIATIYNAVIYEYKINEEYSSPKEAKQV